MIIRLLTQLADKAGTKKLELKLLEGNIKIRELLAIIARSDNIAAAVLSNRDLADDVYILINGVHFSQLGGLEAIVNNNDVVIFVPVAEAG